MAFGSEAWDAATRRDLDIAYREAERKRQNDQIAFENQQRLQGTLASLLTGGGQGGGVPTMPQDNRFSAGLSDAEARLRALLDNPDSITNSAAYKFRVNQGQEALQRSLGAKGLLNSGNRLMELTKYGQDMGSQEYENQYGRLASLLGNYSQGYLGDKNANTARYSAESTAMANADRNNLSRASLAWDMQRTTPTNHTISSMGQVFGQPLGAIGGNTPVDWTSFVEQQRKQRDYLDRY